MPKRIPIAAAKRLAADLGLRQVIIVAHDGERAHVVTYGKSREDCRLAAESGNNLKRHMGWPEDLCNAKPARVRVSQEFNL